MRVVYKCRACDSPNLKEVVNLGEQYVSDFRKDDSKPNKYPIEAILCTDCMLLQLRHTTPSGDMYHDNYGFKSGVSDSIKADLRDNVEYAQSFVHSPKNWLDIASNDGTLLSFVPRATRRVGIDPVPFLCEEAEPHADKIINDFFDAKYFDEQFDVITSISCFYDMDDPNKFVGDVATVLRDDGIWVIQQNYFLPTLELNAIDNFCHEHLEYYTLMSLENLLDKHGLEVVDVFTSSVNGGSLRTAVAHKGKFEVSQSVEAQRVIERAKGLYDTETYLEFGKDAMQKVNQLKELVEDIKNNGKSVAILAASTRGATIWQAAGFGPRTIDFAVERNPAKVGKNFSAIGVPIISEEEARSRRPDYMIIGPWFFADEIIKREDEYRKQGGKLILPLPEVKVI